MFPFRHLPPELRLKIWEDTWPEPRVIEVADLHAYSHSLDKSVHGESESDEDEPDESKPEEITIDYDCLCLRPTSRLSRWLHVDFGDRIVEEPPLEKCLDPISLWVNHESRVHTLRRFIPIQHPRLPFAFYFNPRQRLQELRCLIRSKYNSSHCRVVAIDLAKKVQYFTLEVISSVDLGKIFGMLLSEADFDDYLNSNEGARRRQRCRGHGNQLDRLILDRQTLRAPSPGDHNGFGKMMATCFHYVDERLRLSEDGAIGL